MGATNSNTKENHENSEENSTQNNTSEGAAVAEVEKVEPETENGVQTKNDGSIIGIKSISQIVEEQIGVLLVERQKLLKDRMEDERILREKDIQLNEQVQVIALHNRMLDQYITSELEYIKSHPIRPFNHQIKLKPLTIGQKKITHTQSQTDNGMGVIRKKSSKRRSYSFKGHHLTSSHKEFENSPNSAESHQPDLNERLQDPRPSVKVPQRAEPFSHQYNDIRSHKENYVDGNETKFTKFSKSYKTREYDRDESQKLNFAFNIFPSKSTKARRNTWNGGQRRMMVEFRCPGCERGWTSANCFSGVPQKCTKCLIDVVPSKPLSLTQQR